MAENSENEDLDMLLELLEENNSEISETLESNEISGNTTTSMNEELPVLNLHDCITSKPMIQQLDQYKKQKSESCSSIENLSKETPDIDPLEKELSLMEQKMRKLKEEILKKKNIKINNSENIGFTKYSNPVSSHNNETSTRYLNQTETKSLLEGLKKQKSEIHSGDTDSEDDEDSRNPFEAQLSSYGREMKRTLAQSQMEVGHYSKTKNFNGSGWKGAKGGSLLPMGEKVMKNNASESSNEKASTEAFSGIKITNPLVSTDTMKNLMSGRKMIQMSTIFSYLRKGEIDGDWVTVGVIVSKSETKTSQKGTQYSIWQMSDLKDCTKVVSLFLFAGAYKNLWKTTVGSVVGVLNPQVMKESNKSNDGRNIVTLSVNTHEKLLMMGISKDLGWCKGRTKQGSSCRQFVNKNVCEFCIFHIQREYQKMSSKRSEIQSSFARVDPRKAFQKRVLGRDQVFYGGQLYGSSNSVKPSPSPMSFNPATKIKDLSTLSSLSTKLKAEKLKESDRKDSFILSNLTDQQIETVKNVSKDNEELGQMLLAPSPGARNLLLHKTTSVHSHSSGERKPTPENLSAREFLAASKKPCLNDSKFKVPAIQKPCLGKGLGPGMDIEIDVSNSSKLNMAKTMAASIIKGKGGIQAKDKNMKRNKDRALSSEFQNKVKKRLREMPDDDQDEGSTCAKKPSKEKSSLPISITSQKSLLGDVDLNSEKFLAMLKTKSSHTKLLQVAEDEEVEKYFHSLEKKEMIEDKMATITEVPCKAVVCVQCKYKAMSAAEHCRKENHRLKVTEATKRFFECRNCKQRTISLEKLPLKCCSHCSQSSWRRVAMGKDKLGPKLECETLSLRGDELAHVSSSSNKIYLNL